MTDRVNRIAVLGSTGSIGRSTLDVIEASQGRLQAVALTAHRQVDRLIEQAVRYRPRYIVLTDPEAAHRVNFGDLPSETELLTGPDALIRISTSDEVDTVVSAIVGSAGLQSTLAAAQSGKRIALANKESLVMGGPLVTQAAEKKRAKLLPVDSEHSAIYQCLGAGRRRELKQIILTASGGPFRTWPLEQLAEVTVDEALAHPTWNMGRKITIDSATLMNKALEIIEARWLFGLGDDEISVVLHPQSVIHSMVEFVDGSVIAQMSPPDMRLPIQFALMWPDRTNGVARRVDWTETMQLDLIPPDLDRFEAIRLGLEVARSGGTAGAVLNAANEAAVQAFLDKKLRFDQIVTTCRAILEHHTYEANPTLDQLFALDRWAREEVTRCLAN